MHIPKRFQGILAGVGFILAAPVFIGVMSPSALVSAHDLTGTVPTPTPVAFVGSNTPVLMNSPSPSVLGVVTMGPTPYVMTPTPTPKPKPQYIFSAPAFTPPPANTSRAYALSVLPSYGWGADVTTQFACLNALWNRESGWNPYDLNRWSGAYGIPQALPGSKMAADGADWKTNPDTQIAWGLHYIKGKYGTPCGAWAHSRAYGWY